MDKRVKRDKGEHSRPSKLKMEGTHNEGRRVEYHWRMYQAVSDASRLWMATRRGRCR